jgi:6-phosphogluconolactonase
MDEIEWWEFDTARRWRSRRRGTSPSSSKARSRRIRAPGSLAGRLASDLIYGAAGPVDGHRLVEGDDHADRRPAGGARRPAEPLPEARKLFRSQGRRIVSLVDEAALGDRQEAGRLADARLSLVGWPLDLACLGVGVDGHTAGIFPDPISSAPSPARASAEPSASAGPDAGSGAGRAGHPDRAGSGLGAGDHDRHRRRGEAARARAGDQGRPALRAPIGRLLAGVESPIDIFWSAEG